MVRCNVEQQVKDNDFDARNEDKSLQGAAAWKQNQEEIPKERACSLNDSALTAFARLELTINCEAESSQTVLFFCVKYNSVRHHRVEE